MENRLQALLNSGHTPSASDYYKFPIQGRTKVRWVQAPKKELKEIQSKLLDILTEQYPIKSKYAMAYSPNKSNITNAKAHLGSTFALGIDFKDFFSSIKREDISKRIDNDSIRAVVAKYAFLNGGLVIGAPTSPHLSNMLLEEFDEIIGKFCDERNLKYTRYADDITISGTSKFVVGEIITKINETIVLYAPKVKINRDKTKFSRIENGLRVTGVNVVNSHQVSVPNKMRSQLKLDLYKYRVHGLGDFETLKGRLIYFAQVNKKQAVKIMVYFNKNFNWRILG